MYSKSQLAARWFRYYVAAANSRGHGIHSPFVYTLIREVFNDQTEYYAYKLIETVKKHLLEDRRILQVDDFGAGTKKNSQERTVSDIASHAVSEKKFGRLLFRLAKFYRAKNILELGSSLGISTAYLASADPQSTVISIEGAASIATIATENHQKLKLLNISQQTGNFETLLPEMLESGFNPDLVFIDGNHRLKPVLDYFEQLITRQPQHALIVVHDIHWSEQMEKAWEIIQQDPRVTMTIDIFTAGLIFFRPEFQVKQHFTIRF